MSYIFANNDGNLHPSRKVGIQMESNHITHSCRCAAFAVAQLPLLSCLLFCASGYETTLPPQAYSVDNVPVQGEAVRAAKELSGRVVDAAGNPVADAQVALSSEKIGVLVSDGKLRPMHGNIESRIVQTDSKGVFILGQQPAGSFDLIVAHDKGFASIGSDEFINSNDIRLQPWGRIEGQLAEGRRAAGNKIWMAGLPNSTWFLHEREYRYETQCDTDGRFVFEKVPAGWFEAGYLIRTGEMGASITSRTPVEVKSDETAKITLGGSGRPVIGSFVPPEGYAKPIYFGNGLRSLITTRPDEPRPRNYERMTKREQQQWRAQWRKSDEYKLYRDSYWHDPNWRQYTFRINDDGSFRIEDVIAGKYDVTVWIEERLTGEARPEEIGSYHGTIQVPQVPGGRSDEPLDLGQLELVMHDPLRVGDMAPLFEAKTLDDKSLKLIDYRGKFVLLSFWQPVSHPEIERLRELYDAYSLDGRLQIIGLGGHDTLEEVEKYVQENPIPWPQIFVSEEFKSGIARDYRIPGVPWIFLVGPDGKIIATGQRGEKLTSAVRGALEP
ncbi:MAG: redoxin domain-containing protein [Phycisphaerales bacterium]|nr:MAG: redoxin domain-containing protein [Phycisphaerales bacterium]